MSSTTTNLELFKYDTITDGNLPFNINDALNANWDIIDNAVGEVSETYVKKSGDTINGLLNISYEGSPLNVIRTSWEFTSPPSGHENNYITFRDKNNQSIACIQQRFGTDYNDLWFRIRPLGDNTTEMSGLPGLGIRNVNGNTYAYAPASTTANSVCTTLSINKSNNGYVKFGNGIILQWGHVTVATEKAYTVTYSLAFSGTYTYCITKNYASHKSTTCQDREQGFYARSASGSTTYADEEDTDGFSWMAIGY